MSADDYAISATHTAKGTHGVWAILIKRLCELGAGRLDKRNKLAENFVLMTRGVL